MVKLFVALRSCLPVFVLALVTAIAAADEGPKPRSEQSSTLGRVFAAWKARQERVKTFHVVWDTRIVFPKGAFSLPLLRGLAGLRSAGVSSMARGILNLRCDNPNGGVKEPIGCGATSASSSTTTQAAGLRERGSACLTMAASIRGCMCPPTNPSRRHWPSGGT